MKYNFTIAFLSECCHKSFTILIQVDFVSENT
jgi:hypothetical protein